MKKTLLATTLGVAMVATAPAHAAQSDSDTFDINASVAKACTMENLADIELGNVAINSSAGLSALHINGTSSGSNSAFVSCNDTNSMTISSENNGRLVNAAGVPGGADAGFKATINYSLAASGYLNGFIQPGFRRTLFGLVQVGNNISRGAIHRQVQFGALIDPLNNLDARPVSGSYSDTVTVTVTAS